jgi:hypothetical protein
MKHLKKFFESQEEDYIKYYGLYPEDIKDMFVELSDDGWMVNVDFKKKLFQHRAVINSPLADKDITLNLQAVIEVRIKKNIFGFMTINEIKSELYKLIQSEEMKEIMEVAGNRLKDYGLFISAYNMELDYLKILIYKNNI